MQDCVYQTPVRDMTNLKQRLTDAWNVLSQSIVVMSTNGGRDLGPASMKKEDISNICCNSSLGCAVNLVVF